MHTSEGMRPGRPPQMGLPEHAVGRHSNMPLALRLRQSHQSIVMSHQSQVKKEDDKARAISPVLRSPDMPRSPPDRT